MSKKQIIAEIKNGEVTLTVKGVKGKACRELTKSFEEAVGTRLSTTDTPEMQERPLYAKNSSQDIRG